MGDDVGTGLVPHPPGRAEVVGMTVRHDHRVHATHRDARRREARLERATRGAAGEAGIDDRRTALVLEHVAVDVTEAGHVDRQLGAQDPGSDLGDSLTGRLLLLLGGPRRHHAISSMILPTLALASM